MFAAKHFTLSEFTRSSGLPANQAPPDAVVNALTHLCAALLDPLRAKVDVPIRITSGYRTPAHNKAIGGSATSQHMKGEAADIKVSGLTSEQVLLAIKASGLPFDQVIGYDVKDGGHTHVSVKPSGNRGQLLWKRGSGYLAATNGRPA